MPDLHDDEIAPPGAPENLDPAPPLDVDEPGSEAPEDLDPAPAGDLAPEVQPAPVRQARSSGFLVAVTLAAVFFVTTVVFAVVAVGQKGENDELRSERDDVMAVAGQFMDALLRFDHADPEAHREAVLALSASQFRAQFEEAFDETVALYEEFGAVATPTIQAVYVGDLGDGQAQAIVEYDRIIETADRTNTEEGFYAQLDLARIDGEWLVTNVFNINFALGAGGGIDPAAGSTTTTTTSP